MCVCRRCSVTGIYLRQRTALHLLSTPAQISYIAAGQDALQGALQRQAVLPEVPHPVEEVRAGSAGQYQVQQSLHRQAETWRLLPLCTLQVRTLADALRLTETL